MALLRDYDPLMKNKPVNITMGEGLLEPLPHIKTTSMFQLLEDKL